MTVSNYSVLILACIILLPCAQTADYPLAAIGLSAAFGCILPGAIGLGARYIEKHFDLDTRRPWSPERHCDLESSRFLNTSLISAISLVTWYVLRDTVANDMRMALILTSVYSYGQGRAFNMQRESHLQKSTSFLLPTAIGILAYTRIPDLAPQLDLAGKSILVLGLAHFGA